MEAVRQLEEVIGEDVWAEVVQDGGNDFGEWFSQAAPGMQALTVSAVSDILSDMKVSTRSLVREFPKAKAAARKGQPVEIYDGRTGEAFFLTAKPTRTFGELAEMAKGVYLGPRDLSSREGFDA